MPLQRHQNFTFLPFYFFTFICCKVTKITNAKQYFPPIIFKKFQMLKSTQKDCNATLRSLVEEPSLLCTFAPEITWGGAGNRVEKFRKSRGKVEEIAKRSSGNHVEKFKKSPGRVSTLSGNTRQRGSAATRHLRN
jgi:hypothetical protein